ncbi:MAG: hypothetical protein K2G97_04095 [Oscillospiraceae bacterium]|nr:hypothetical protein [Oscillospiraceae bacterium]
MKTKIIFVPLFLLCMILFSGCNSQNIQNQTESCESSVLESNTQIKKYSVDEYMIVRNIFIDKYKTTVEMIQKEISSFNLSEDWWNNYKSLHNDVDNMSAAFLEIREKVPDENMNDFNNIKDEIDKYSIAINKIEEAYGKNADEQAIMIAEGVKNMNIANYHWKNKIGD